MCFLIWRKKYIYANQVFADFRCEKSTIDIEYNELSLEDEAEIGQDMVENGWTSRGYGSSWDGNILTHIKEAIPAKLGLGRLEWSTASYTAIIRANHDVKWN